MKGHLTTKNGTWYAVYDAIDPASGKRRRKWLKLDGCKGKREAQDKWALEKAAMINGTFIDPAKTTVAQWFDVWLTHIKPNVSPRTHERYTEICQKNLAPLIGRVILSKLCPAQVSAAYAKAHASGRRVLPGRPIKAGQEGLSARTVLHIHRVLFSALRLAVRWGKLSRNPADLEKKDRPKVERKAVATIDAGATVDVIDAARERPLFLAVLLGSMTGLRRGEITALRWKSVDLDRAQLAVIASTEQTKAGIREKDAKGSKCRTLAIPGLLIDELRRHRLTQAEEQLRLGIRVSGETHVMTLPDASPWQPNSLTHAIGKFMKAQGQKVRLHGLRHSHASHLLASNVHPKIVQERFGHSSVAITMDIYSHLMPNMQTDAVALVDGVFRAAIDKRG